MSSVAQAKQAIIEADKTREVLKQARRELRDEKVAVTNKRIRTMSTIEFIASMVLVGLASSLLTVIVSVMFGVVIGLVLGGSLFVTLVVRFVRARFVVV